MANIVTQAERDQAVKDLAAMDIEDVRLLKNMIIEQDFERQAAFGIGYCLAPAEIEETGEPVSRLLYELCYKARVDKLFEERDQLRRC